MEPIGCPATPARRLTTAGRSFCTYVEANWEFFYDECNGTADPMNYGVSKGIAAFEVKQFEAKLGQTLE